MVVSTHVPLLSANETTAAVIIWACMAELLLQCGDGGQRGLAALCARETSVGNINIAGFSA